MNETSGGAGVWRRSRPTIEDIAVEAGVSRSLVSLVLRDKPGAGPATRERIHQVAKDLGYRPDPAARMLAAQGGRGMLGVVMTMHNSFHAQLMDALYPIVESRGYQLLLSGVSPNRDELRAVETLLEFRCDGLILLGPSLVASDIPNLTRQNAVVVVGRKAIEPNMSAVHPAEGKGVRLVIDHLVELGHRDIVHIDGGNRPASVPRRRAYQSSMKRHGLEQYIRVLPGDHTEESGMMLGEKLLADPDHMPTAVFAGNDRCAIGLLDSLHRGGLRVPDHVSVVGYDDNALAHMSHINLTTVNQNPQRQAELAVELVIKNIERHGMDPRDHSVDPHLVIRGTSGPPSS